MKAARDGKRDLVERRLEKLGKGNKKINKKDQENTTALHYAVRYNHLHIVKLLLEYGAGKEKLEQLITLCSDYYSVCMCSHLNVKCSLTNL